MYFKPETQSVNKRRTKKQRQKQKSSQYDSDTASLKFSKDELPSRESRKIQKYHQIRTKRSNMKVSVKKPNENQIPQFHVDLGKMTHKLTGKEMLQKIYDTLMPNKIKVIGCGPYGKEAFVAKVPLYGVADLKGLKLRSPEGLAADVFRRAGASPSSIPFSRSTYIYIISSC